MSDRRTAIFAGVASVACACAGCSSDDSTTAGAPDAGADASDGGTACGASGIGKGPLSLAIRDDSFTIRWEACRSGTAPEATLTPEDGGATKSVTSTETAVTTTTVDDALLLPTLPGDLPGTYYMHDAKVEGLTSGACFTYALAADPTRTGRVCTSRPSGDPLRFLAIGDTNPGLGDNTVNVLDHALTNPIDFALHAGDIQYYDSGVETWVYWFSRMQPLLSAGAFFPCIGNHEDERPNEFVDYYTRFFGGGGYGGQTEYYSFASAGVHFFSLDTQMPLDPGAPQRTWFEGALASAAASPGYRFSVVYLHRPFATCGDADDHWDTFQSMEPLFLANHVPLVVQGHMHGYERFTIDGITLVTAAGGGGRLGDVDANIARPECPMRVASGAFFNAVVFDVAPGTLSGRAIDADGMTRDTFTVIVP